MKKITILSLIIMIIDQIIKLIIINNLVPYDNITVIENFFNITYVKNIGAAFSMFSGNVFLLSIISLIVLIFIFVFFIKDKQIGKNKIVIYSLLIGGILGNLADRIFRGYVIDYLHFYALGYNFPVFNFADMCIVISTIILLLINIKEEKNEVQNK